MLQNFLPSGPERTWRESLQKAGWFRANPSEKKRFVDFVDNENIADYADVGSDLLALDFSYFDPSKNIGLPERVLYLAPFIRPVKTEQATDHLRRFITSNGRQARFAKLADMLLRALVNRKVLNQSGDLFSISPGKHRELKEIPAADLLEENNGIVSIQNFEECGIDYSGLGEVVDSHVVNFAIAGLDEEGFLQLARNHKGASHSVVPLQDLDRWGVNDIGKLKNIFQKALDNMSFARAQLNETGDAIFLDAPDVDQLNHMKEEKLSRLKKLEALVVTETKKDERNLKLIEREQVKRQQKDREMIKAYGEGDKLMIRLLALREIRKHLGSDVEENA